jgi:hypothetical protein
MTTTTTQSAEFKRTTCRQVCQPEAVRGCSTTTHAPSRRHQRLWTVMKSMPMPDRNGNTRSKGQTQIHTYSRTHSRTHTHTHTHRHTLSLRSLFSTLSLTLCSLSRFSATAPGGWAVVMKQKAHGRRHEKQLRVRTRPARRHTRTRTSIHTRKENTPSLSVEVVGLAGCSYLRWSRGPSAKSRLR